MAQCCVLGDGPVQLLGQGTAASCWNVTLRNVPSLSAEFSINGNELNVDPIISPDLGNDLTLSASGLYTPAESKVYGLADRAPSTELTQPEALKNIQMSALTATGAEPSFLSGPAVTFFFNWPATEQRQLMGVFLFGGQSSRVRLADLGGDPGCRIRELVEMQYIAGGPPVVVDQRRSIRVDAAWAAAGETYTHSFGEVTLITRPWIMNPGDSGVVIFRRDYEAVFGRPFLIGGGGARIRIIAFTVD